MAAVSAHRALETATRAAGVSESAGERMTTSTLKSTTTSSPSLPPSVVEAAASDFASRGLAVVPSFLAAEELEALREECGSVVLEAAGGRGRSDEQVSEFLVESSGCVVQTLPRGSQGCLAAATGDSSGVSLARSSYPCTRRGAEIVLGEKLASFAMALLVAAEEEEDEEGDESEKKTSTSNRQQPQQQPLVLIGEQYIVKPPRGGPRTAFGWHADGSWLEAGMSEACPEEPRREEERRRRQRTTAEADADSERDNGRLRLPERQKRKQTYLSIWIALDDVGPGNGGLVLPGEDEIEELAERERRRRRRRKGFDEEENFDSPCSSSPLVAPAGTAVAMASWLRHASGPNDSSAARRAWMPQLKLGPVVVDVDDVEGGEEDDHDDDDDDGNKGPSSRAGGASDSARAAARETWRVPVPCIPIAP